MLVALPILLLGIPILLTGFFVANNLAGAILGPPAIWERPSNTPPYQDLVGEYQEISRRTEDATHGNASLILRADGTMVIDGLPYEFYPKSCIVRGTGRWNGPRSDDQRIDLVITHETHEEGPEVCASGEYFGLEVTGHSKPYGLYWIIGDPDSGTGVRLSRKKD
jgi:hypothetical protein